MPAHGDPLVGGRGDGHALRVRGGTSRGVPVSLSFREQAAIAYATVRDSAGGLNSEGYIESGGNFVLSYQDAAIGAQALADECCKQWGHQWDPETRMCRRCDAERGGDR